MKLAGSSVLGPSTSTTCSSRAPRYQPRPAPLDAGRVLEAKVSWLAAQLTTLDADVIGLQELWHRDAMVAVLQAAGLTDSYDLLAEPIGYLNRRRCPGSAACCCTAPRWVDRFPDGVHRNLRP